MNNWKKELRYTGLSYEALCLSGEELGCVSCRSSEDNISSHVLVLSPLLSLCSCETPSSTEAELGRLSAMTPAVMMGTVAGWSNTALQPGGPALVPQPA